MQILLRNYQLVNCTVIREKNYGLLIRTRVTFFFYKPIYPICLERETESRVIRLCVEFDLVNSVYRFLTFGYLALGWTLIYLQFEK